MAVRIVSRLAEIALFFMVATVLAVGVMSMR